MDVVTKATATVTPVEDSKSKHGEFDVILSTNALDRDGDELHADEWKQPLPDKITFDSDHGMSVATCVGSGKPFINDHGQLQVRGTFASTPHGQAVRTLVNEGHIDSVSVAFMDRKTQKSGRPLRELLNGAFVAVPANPEARVLSSKSADDKKKPYGDVTYADPKNNKYPIDTEEHVRAAWSYINMERNASEYSAEELSAIKGRIKRAMEKFGIDTDKKAVKEQQESNYRLDEMASINDMFTNDPLDSDQLPGTPEYYRAVHDLAVKLGGTRLCNGMPDSDPTAIPDVVQSYNRSVTDTAVLRKKLAAFEEVFDFMIKRAPIPVGQVTTAPTITIENYNTKGDGLSAEPCNCSCAGCTCPSSKSLPPKSAEKRASTGAPSDAAAAGTDDSADDVARAKALVMRLAITD